MIDPTSALIGTVMGCLIGFPFGQLIKISYQSGKTFLISKNDGEVKRL